MARLTLEIRISSIAARSVAGALFCITAALLSYAAITNFIVSALTDERASVDSSMLLAASASYPNSARLQARLAESLSLERSFADAEGCARRALQLTPRSYAYRLLMASIKESRGDAAGAEQELRESVALAAHKTEPRWQLANLLLRAGKRDASLVEFRAAGAMNPRLLPVTLSIIWRATDANLQALDAVTAADPRSRVALAGFLLKQSRSGDAARVFRQIDPDARRPLVESRDLIKAIAREDVELARNLWIDLVSGNSGEYTLLWNGGFESDLSPEFNQFDWVLDRSEYARTRVASGAAHSGSRALRVDFLGRDTTKLNGEIRQTVALRPGAHYRLTCYAKPENLVTPEGPCIAVSSGALPNWIAQSAPVVATLTGWQQLSIDFIPPQLPTGTQPAFMVTVRRKPRFSYDEPTTGSVSFDDFALIEEIPEPAASAKNPVKPAIRTEVKQ